MTEDATGDWDVETGALVVGGGGAGLVAAVTLADAGVRTTLLEAAGSLGGTTAKSGGSIVAAGSALQAAAGIEDAPAQLVADLRHKTDGECDVDFARAIAEESPLTIDWLAEDLGLELTVNTGPYGRIGHRTFRRHWLVDEDGVVQRDGRYLVDRLAAAARSRDVELLTAVPVRELVGDVDGVHGAVAGHDGDERIGADAVLLACGGHAGDPELRREYFPGEVDPVFAGAPTNTGAALRWARAIGARTAHLEGFNVIGHFTAPEGIHFPWALSKAGAFVVNERGERFADVASSSYSAFAERLLEQPGGRGWIVFDDVALDSMRENPSSRTLIRECLDHGAFESADTVETLAERLDLPATAMAETFTAVNRHRHRKLSPTVYGTEIQPAVLGAQGGVDTTPRGAVRSTAGGTIPGLYGGGLATVGLSGSSPGGYLSGNGLLHALNSGRLMGTAAVEDVFAP